MPLLAPSNSSCSKMTRLANQVQAKHLFQYEGHLIHLQFKTGIFDPRLYDEWGRSQAGQQCKHTVFQTPFHCRRNHRNHSNHPPLSNYIHTHITSASVKFRVCLQLSMRSQIKQLQNRNGAFKADLKIESNIYDLVWWEILINVWYYSPVLNAQCQKLVLQYQYNDRK